LLTVLGLGVLGAVIAPGVSAQTGAEDSAVGSFSVQGLNFTLDAHSGANGENPRGVVEAGEPPTYSVVCLGVTGSVAVIGINQTNGTLGVVLRVEDGPVDTFAFDASLPRPIGPGACASPPSDFPIRYAIGSGDIIVTDASSLPTSTAQCRNGGWRTFGVFKNQGDCVSFVRHRARQACIFERVAHGITVFRSKYGLGPNHEHAMRHCVRFYTGF
jgi:hypothetical protein